MTRANVLFRWALMNLAITGLAFLCGGTLVLPALRAYLALFAAFTLLAAFVVDPNFSKKGATQVT